MPADSPCPGRPSIQQYFQVLLVLTVGSGLVVTLALSGLGSLLLLRVTLPSLSASDASGRMRGWRASLFRGLGSTSAVTWLLWIAIFVIPPVGVVGLHGPFPPFLAAGLHAAQRFTISTIGVIAILATVMIASITMLGGSVLDVMLSLDNYLRTLPDDEAPQARIVERYVSLLRHIASAGTTAETSTPYTAVVIVATSFGAPFRLTCLAS